MPYPDVYITNEGYGGVMLAIENKLPMVLAGVHEGKNEINARIGYFKLGINLRTETPTPEKYGMQLKMFVPIRSIEAMCKNLVKSFHILNLIHLLLNI